MSQFEPVVVTGIGVACAIGDNHAEFRESIFNGRSGLNRISKVAGFDPSPSKAVHAGVIPNFDSVPVPQTKREIGNSITQLMRKMDRVTKLSVIAAEEARADSGVEIDDISPTRIGIVLGTAFDGLVTIEEYYRAVVQKGARHASPALFPFTLPNSINGAVSIHMGIKGVNSSLATGAVSGLASVGYGLDLLRAGRADYILAGAADIFGEPVFRAMDFLRCVTPYRDGGAETVAPFGRDRNGFPMGEAGAFVLLERRATAEKRGATIHCELAGYANTYDGWKTADNDPQGTGVAAAVRGALRDAGVDAGSIDYVAASANGAVAGDRAEAQGLRAAFGAHADTVPVSSIKGLTGETFSAGGILSMIQAIAAIQRGAVPPHRSGLTGKITLGDDIPLGHVPSEVEERRVRTALANSVCYTGNNASVVVRAV